MKHLIDYFPQLFIYGLLALVGLAVFLLIVGLVMIPVQWVSGKFNDSRCPKCRGFFKRKLVDWEISDEKEVLKTVNRIDQGTISSNSLFEPSHIVQINRQEQVVFVEQTILNRWTCSDSLCGHKWTTEDVRDWEGYLE